MRSSASMVLAILVGADACESYPEPEIQAPRATHAAMVPGEAEPDLEIMPEGKFCDALFPCFEPDRVPANSDELAALLARPAVKRRVEALAIRYVVVTAGNTTKKDEGIFFCGGGGMSPAVGCLGFSTQDLKSRMTAAVWDLEQVTSAGQLTANTTGTNVAIGVVVPIFFLSDTKTAACEGLGTRLARFVTGNSPASD